MEAQTAGVFLRRVAIMRRVLGIVFCASAITYGAAWATEVDSDLDPALATEIDDAQSNGRTSDDSNASPCQPPRDRSRYHWQQGRWWYDLPSGRQLVWDGKQWQYGEQSPAESSSRAPKPTQSSAGRFARNLVGAWRGNLPRTERGWVGGFYSSGGGYGASDFGYGYGVPTYDPVQPH
jgi:hypothetical protein